jgi:hypothetical protein
MEIRKEIAEKIAEKTALIEELYKKGQAPKDANGILNVLLFETEPNTLEAAMAGVVAYRFSHFIKTGIVI